MKKLFNYFISGLLVVFPIGATAFIFFIGVKTLDRFLGDILFDLVGFRLPGLGILITFLAIVLVGYFLNSFIGKSLLRRLDLIISRTPLIKIIYTALRDFSEALVGEKRKFKEPVLVKMSGSGAKKFGFITQNDLSHLDIKDHVAVYIPYSYGIMGDFYVIPVENITHLNANSTDLMKFIVSAGLTSVKDIKKKKNNSV